MESMFPYEQIGYRVGGGGVVMVWLSKYTEQSLMARFHLLIPIYCPAVAD